MKIPRNTKTGTMTPDAYAGFLKLLLTPGSSVPRPSADVDAYLRYASQREPLSDEVRRALGQPRVRAA